MLFLFLLACAPPAIDTSPSVEVIWPPDEMAVVSCAMVVVTLKNFTLVDATDSPAAVDGEGHFHVEYPGSYTFCYTPYCLVDLSTVTSTAPTLTAYLVGNDHQPITDADGNRIEDSVPITLSQGMCTEGTPQAHDSGWDSGQDSGGS
jgi:hypothetical protein